MIVVVDGQTRATWPIRSKSGANILPESIDQCKGYSAFAVLLDSLNVDQPDGGDGSDLGSGVSARGVCSTWFLSLPVTCCQMLVCLWVRTRAIWRIT
ncbi:uncharacterized protein PITG_15011 [Phytophthora infestans T30-4]|uniref:Uncharacterized protein n=1 Tax=Phytophthora infestans (strain T30-4) TaxID=403677 RepID=D0NRG0_PHYIT|nr:uncharacterized protein PITG_15011 [Phytophthora infestans T30-4]EEY63310.1 hypothetical protein PITG_15011 [Phytophthora infestans T30-4]|eukprot:XP_002898195.1 hypothetical protein PITG_15011 [Phytophthora infestans T30-4]